MNRNYFLIILALVIGSLVLIVTFMRNTAHQPVPQDHHIPHPVSPFKSSISAVGIVEASSENISITTTLNRAVTAVSVTVGAKVKKGDILIKFDDSDLKADFAAAKASYDASVAKLKKLESLPRKEDLLSAQAALKSSQVQLSLAKSRYEMVKGLETTRAVSQEEINHRQFSYEQAEAKWMEAKAAFEKIKEGAWKPDLDIARLEVQLEQANMQKIKTEIDKTVIRSPIEGTILQIRIHPGEYPSQDPTRSPLMVVGNTENLHLRVSINQFEAPYFNPKAPAIAFLQGDARIKFDLEFVNLEPYLVDKQNLTNNIMEKVDTRVLQVIYRFKTTDPRIYVGQQMDVFIENEYR